MPIITLQKAAMPGDKIYYVTVGIYNFTYIYSNERIVKSFNSAIITKCGSQINH